MIYVFLQNAWSPAYAGEEWPRESWLRALWACKSGKRLDTLIKGLECRPWNTTPIVGKSPRSVVPPDRDHIEGILAHKPIVVVACGKQAEDALLSLWLGPLLVVPHPAHRSLTNKLYKKGNRMLKGGYNRRLALRQLKDHIRTEKL